MRIAALVLGVGSIAALLQDQERTPFVGRQWLFYPNENLIQLVGKDVYVVHTGSGSTEGHAYGVLRLDFPKTASEYVIEFRVRFGEPGSAPTRVDLMSGAEKPLSVAADGESKRIRIASHDRELYTADYDDNWRAIKVEGAKGVVKVSLYGRELGKSPSKGMPDILVFGGIKGKAGVQTEAWLRLDRAAFRAGPAGATSAPAAAEEAGAFEPVLLELRQRQIAESSGRSTWQWTARVRMKNPDSGPLDCVLLPELRIVTDDYREYLCRPASADRASDTLAWLEPGQLKIAPGQTMEVDFASPAEVASPGGRPIRVELGPKGRSVGLEPPPPTADDR